MLRLPVRTRGLTVGLLTCLSVMAVQSQAPPTALPSEPLIFAGAGPGSGQLRIFQANGTPLVAVAAVVAFLQGLNPGAETGLASTNSPPGGGFVGGAACPVP